ncbi:MAG: Holliday junction resolvase RuvX [Flavobacteriales bacterium]
MGRILAIDHGNKRCGLAVTDPLQLSVNPLETVHSREVIARLKEFAQKEELESFVVGAPSSEDGSPSSHTRASDEFCIHLSRKFPDIPVKRVDESFTSREAMNIMRRSGVTKKEREKKERVDQLSACLILERYLGLETAS